MSDYESTPLQDAPKHDNPNEISRRGEKIAWAILFSVVSAILMFILRGGMLLLIALPGAAFRG